MPFAREKPAAGNRGWRAKWHHGEDPHRAGRRPVPAGDNVLEKLPGGGGRVEALKFL